MINWICIPALSDFMIENYGKPFAFNANGICVHGVLPRMPKRQTIPVRLGTSHGIKFAKNLIG